MPTRFSERLRDKAIEAIYAAAGAPDLWPAALDAIAACYDAVGTVLILRRKSGAMTIVSPCLATAAAEYEATAWKLDFMVDRAFEASLAAPSSCYTDRHLATPEEIATHPFYRDFRARHGLGPFLGTMISPHPDAPVIVTMQGAIHRAPFSDAELESYGRLARHVERALALSIRLMDAQTGQVALGEALSQLTCGAFLLDGEGRLTFANQEGRRLLQGPLRLAGEKLALRGPEASALDAAVADASDVAAARLMPPILIGREGDDGRATHVIYVLPIRPHAIWSDALSTVRATVLVLPRDPGGPSDPALLRDLLGLTLGEARLAALIGAGQTPREASVTLGVTEASARTVLKRVFAKVGVARQADLAALIERISLRPDAG